MSSTAKHSPTKRNVANLNSKVARLETYEQWKAPTIIDFEALLGKDAWNSYWQLWDALIDEMRKCQEVADLLREQIVAAIRPK